MAKKASKATAQAAIAMVSDLTAIGVPYGYRLRNIYNNANTIAAGFKTEIT